MSIHYFSLHTESARSAFKELLRQPVGTLLTLVMLAVAMTLPLFLYLGVQSGQSVLGKLNESPQITVYLDTHAAKEDADTVAALLKQDQRLDKIRFVGKQEGLQELQSNLDQNLVSILDENPLPDVFIVTPDARFTPQQMQAVYDDLLKLPMVESAAMDTEWVRTLYQINEFIRKILWFLAVTLGMAFVLVAHNTIRLQILSRKEEIEITKLLGAPASFIRRPFLYQAVWQALLASAVSLGLCGWLLAAVRPLVDAIFKPYGLNIVWRFFNGGETALILGAVTALGVFGAWLATTQHLLGFKAKK
ncbi:permease-like cell division protein FtsX [Neisseria sp. ZJ106]|uniref:Cell division protein FtsX n=1 Tax=Neisseria lisongii TaxID=2912188 RepID=A0AAW5AQQ6_9NEIS|nr:permease-like cell division protein FtsX [Neisseria lisongii]MCF7520884.1 permease-like cell division protein FtsX [Neisseria lisongii]MCF7530522.1 permease-like cell division protein FtsX [Neisseria lisongii]WCL71307.1 permease-like cell division protein FtsX [Neisseria lisongii]